MILLGFALTRAETFDQATSVTAPHFRLQLMPTDTTPASDWKTRAEAEGKTLSEALEGLITRIQQESPAKFQFAPYRESITDRIDSRTRVRTKGAQSEALFLMYFFPEPTKDAPLFPGNLYVQIALKQPPAREQLQILEGRVLEAFNQKKTRWRKTPPESSGR